MHTTVSSVSKCIITIEMFYRAKRGEIDDLVCARELHFLLILSRDISRVSPHILAYLSPNFGPKIPKLRLQTP